MSIEIPESALAIKATLDHYAKIGLEDPILCGGSDLYWQLAIATGPKIDALPISLSDVDALAPYVSIRALHESTKADGKYNITEWRDSPKPTNGRRDRATLHVETPVTPDGVLTLEAFTGVETDRISVTHEVVSRYNEAIDVQGIACLPIARILAWKILADRAKDRAQVAAYMSYIKQTRAVSYDEWDAIRDATQQARDKLWSVKHATEQIRWSGSTS